MTTAHGTNPYLSHTKDRARTDELWERFNVSGGAFRPEHPNSYEELLLADWERCRRFGVDAEMHKVPVVSDDEFQRLLGSRKMLLDSARPVLEKVQELFVGVPGILILGDQEGTILYIGGDPRVRLRAANKSNLIEGGRWAESVAGTNGIGTAIARKMPVHVYSSEHFCEGWHMWTCAGAPILDPLTEEVVGVIDFTTYEKDFRENAIALSYSLAANVTSEIRLQRELEQVQLVHQYALFASRYPGEDILVVDRNGRVVRTNFDVKPGARVETSPGSPEWEERVSQVHSIAFPGSEAVIGSVIVAKPERRHQVFTVGADLAAERTSYSGFVTADRPTKQIMERIRRAAHSELSVLLIGETGTGKEMIARFIHEESQRRAGPYIAVNCGAINKELFESTFFGYDRGAFTGADTRGRRGLFESAAGGTLFLDEIGEMPLDIQAGLLRVLETRSFRRVGSDRELSTDCRVIAATNRGLSEMVASGGFRSDLYYRLGVVKFEVQPLRCRPDDIPVLIDLFLDSACSRYGLPKKEIDDAAWRALLRHAWPGNGRELRNVVESACVSADGIIELKDLPPEIVETASTAPSSGACESLAAEAPELAGGQEDFSLRSHEARLILEALKKYKKVSLVAEALGLSRATLYRRFEALGIDHHEASRSSRTRPRDV